MIDVSQINDIAIRLGDTTFQATEWMRFIRYKRFFDPIQPEAYLTDVGEIVGVIWEHQGNSLKMIFPPSDRAILIEVYGLDSEEAGYAIPVEYFALSDRLDDWLKKQGLC